MTASASEGATPGTATESRALDRQLDRLLVTPAELQMMGHLDTAAHYYLAHLEEGIRLRLIALCAAAVETSLPGAATPDLERHVRALLADRRADPVWAPTAAALDHQILKDGELLRALLAAFSAERERAHRLAERRRAVDGFVKELQTQGKANR